MARPPAMPEQRGKSLYSSLDSGAHTQFTVTVSEERRIWTASNKDETECLHETRSLSELQCNMKKRHCICVCGGFTRCEDALATAL